MAAAPNDEQRYTEMDLIRAKRAALVEGATLHGSSMEWAVAWANRKYPLPTVPRVVVVESQTSGKTWFRVGPDGIEHRRTVRGEWHPFITRKEAEAIRSLLANPTEEREAE